jgi:Fe-S cluster assembly protein SufD
MTGVAEAGLHSYVAEIERAGAAWSGQEPSWLTRRREQASECFQTLGFPSTSEEEWRFTNVAPIAKTGFTLPADGRRSVAPSSVTPLSLSTLASAELVFVNGRYAAGLSIIGTLPRGIRVETLATALVAHPDQVEPYLTRVAGFGRQAFTALNTALFADGAFVQVPANVTLDAPIHVLFISTGQGDHVPTMSHPRLLVVAGESSHVPIIESYVGASDHSSSRGDGVYFTNAVTEVIVGDNASVEHYKLQQETAHASHIATMHVIGRRNARFQSHALSFGGSLVRNDVIAVLDGEGIDCTLNGLYLADDRRLMRGAGAPGVIVDNHTTIDHAKPHCGSREIYKGILAGHARAVFNGKIIVRPDAQKTDAKQTNKALLLSEDAQINTKPQLEIFANDVKCTHGAAVGQMDDEAMFYLRARGLGLAEARNLLIHAFASDVLNRLPLEPLRTRAEAALLRQLPNEG